MTGIYNNYSYGFGNIGRRWSPKRQRLVVGRDVAPVHKESPREQTNGIILADSVKLLEAAQTSQGRASEQTRQGFSLKGSISSSINSGNGNTSIRQEQLLVKGGGESVYLVNDGGKSMLRISGGAKDGAGERVIELKQGEDLRISWSKDGQAEVFTGAAALKGGKLAAQGDNEILVRMSGASVEAGTGSTVLNLSGAWGGNFSGGHNVRYLGEYLGSTIEGGTGLTDFGGYFADSVITAEKGQGDFNGVFSATDSKSFIQTGIHDDIFSGYFQVADQIEAGKSKAGIRTSGGDNAFSGTFMGGSSIEGGSGNDIYNGRFFDSKINDQGGDNTFGTYIDLKNKVQADFVRTVIESGSGNDKFTGTAEDSSIKLGDGDDEVDGVLVASTLDAGDGNDQLRLIYASGSVIDMGRGDDELHLITGSGNSVRLGAGNDKMTSGLNVEGSAKYGTVGAFAKSAFLKESESGVDPRFGHHFGDVQSTQIDAGEGENHIAVHDGMNVHSVRSGESQEEGAPAASEDSGLEEVDILGGEARADMAMQNTLLNTMKRLLERTRSGKGGVLAPDMQARLEKNLDALERLREKRNGESGGDSADSRFLTAAVGGWLPNPGGNSVTITGGNGETVSFDTMKRVNFNFAKGEETNHLRALLCKYDKFGGLNSR